MAAFNTFLSMVQYLHLSHNPNSVFLLAFAALPIALYVATSRARPSTKKANLPPQPKPLPFFGNLLEFTALPHRAFARLASTHGPLMYMRLGHVPALVASTAEVAEELLRTHDVSFSDRSRLAMSTVMTYDMQDLTFAPHGEHWKVLRRIAVEEVSNMKKMRAYVKVREEEVAVVMKGVAGRDVVHISELVLNYFNNIICRTVFGRRGTGDDGAMSSWFVDLMAQTSRTMATFCVEDFFPSFRWVTTLTGSTWKIRRFHALFDNFIEGQVRAHEQIAKEGKQQVPCLIQKLHQLQKDPSLGYPLSRENIKGLVEDFMLGGTDTSSITTQWAMSELVNNPSVMEKAQHEIRTLVGERKLVEEKDLEHLPYLKNIVKETLRMYPPTIFLIPRASTKDCNALGYDIPAKIWLLVNVWAIGRDPKYWKEPDRFIPERFEDRDVDNNGHQFFTYLPFGAGRRSCPARSMAVAVIELLLANLLRCFDWEPLEGERVDMEEAVQLTLRRKNPLVLKPKAVIEL